MQSDPYQSSPSGSGYSDVNEAAWGGWGREQRDRRVAPQNIARVACLAWNDYYI